MVEIQLTDEQWKKVVDEWNSRPTNPPSLMELTKLAFGRNDLDGRSVEGKAIRKKMAEANLKVITKTDYTPKGETILSDEQKEIIRETLENNSGRFSVVELTRIIFKNDSLNNLNSETKAVAAEVNKIKGVVTVDNPKEIPQKTWKPPKKIELVIDKINEFTSANFIQEKMTAKERKDAAALLKYLNIFTFGHQINIFTKESDRTLFESSFIRYCFDKHDLTEEEVDQYIDLCVEIVTSSNLQSRIETLRAKLDSNVSGDEHIAHGLTESIDKLQGDYNQSSIRRRKLLDSLKVKRSDKEQQDKGGLMLLTNLVGLWRQEEDRRKIILSQEDHKQELREDIKALTFMDSLKAKIAGISEDEVLNG
jgi:hypothetical protein